MLLQAVPARGQRSPVAPVASAAPVAASPTFAPLPRLAGSLAGRQWESAAQTVSPDYDIAFDGRVTDAQRWLALTLGPVAADGDGGAAASYVAIGEDDPQGAARTVIARRGAVLRPDGWHDFDGGAGVHLRSALGFTPGGDLLAIEPAVGRPGWPGSRTDIRELPRDGHAWFTSAGKPGGPLFSGEQPVALVRADGEALVARLISELDGHWQITLQRRAPGVGGWPAPVRLFEGRSRAGWFDSLALFDGPDGGLLMVWRDAARRLIASRLPAGQTDWTAPRPLGGAPACDAAPLLHLAGDGSLHAAWPMRIAGRDGVQLARLPAAHEAVDGGAGTRVAVSPTAAAGPPVTAGTPATESFGPPRWLAGEPGFSLRALAVGDDGLPVVGWLARSPTGARRAGVSIACADDWLAPDLLDLPPDAGATAFAFDRAGNALLAWSNDPAMPAFHESDDGPAVASQVHASHCLRGSGWSVPRRLDADGTRPARCAEPRLAIAADGSAVVAWKRGERLVAADGTPFMRTRVEARRRV